ncbi:MAG: site-2 protease family protein [Clostridiales bacterium]|jgi:stage IV sporulation protein FB|nr:site-2 protease family protein [Clostridiales bacterium]
MNALITVFGWLVTAAMIIASIALHEWAHIFAIRFMGGQVENPKFFPLGMIAKARRLETLHSWERYVIYAAGPAANFAVAIWSFTVSEISYVGVPWLDELAFYNFALGFFNLTPALPMDGGRITWQFIGNRIGILRTNRFITRLGIAISYAFIVLGFVQVILFPFNITLLCAGMFLRHRNKNLAPELTAAFYRAQDGKNSENRARTLPVKEIPLPRDTKIKHALERIAGDYFITFLIDGKKERLLREQTLINYVFKHGITGTVEEITSTYTA